MFATRDGMRMGTGGPDGVRPHDDRSAPPGKSGAQTFIHGCFVELTVEWRPGLSVAKLHSPMRTIFAAGSRACLACLCVLGAAGLASASTPFVIADFDGD